MKNKRTSVFNLTLNLKKNGLTMQLPGARFLTCCLEDKTLSILEKICASRFIRTNTLVDSIIDKFILTYEDKAIFLRGETSQNLISKVKGIIYTPHPRAFVTYQVREKSFNRVMSIKNEYGLSRSVILKHIINKYLKENGYYG